MTNVFLFIFFFNSNIIEEVKIQLTSESEQVSTTEHEKSISHCDVKFDENLDVGILEDARNTCVDSE